VAAEEFLNLLLLALQSLMDLGLLDDRPPEIPLRCLSQCLVDWLRWDETGVSELRPLWACSSLDNCDVDHGMMVSIGANS
jgi:hypothetical protein